MTKTTPGKTGGIQGTQGNTGDTKDTRGHKGHNWNMGQRRHKGHRGKRGTVSKIVVCLCSVWVKNRNSIPFTNHVGWKENWLKKNDWDPVELSGKATMNFNEAAAALKLLPLLNRSSCWKVLVLYYRWNVQDKWAVCGFGSQLALLWPLNLAFAYLFLVCDT